VDGKQGTGRGFVLVWYDAGDREWLGGAASEGKRGNDDDVIILVSYLREGSLGEDTATRRVSKSKGKQKQNHERIGRAAATNINKQVLPQAPSPTMTSFRRISAIVIDDSG